MKTALSLILFLISMNSNSQPFQGKWTGTVSGSNGTLDSEMNLKYNTTKTQILGEMIVTNSGVKDFYTINTEVSQSLAKGTLKYKDGTVFNIEMTLSGGGLSQKIAYNNQVILLGTFQKGVQKPSIESVKNDGLYRDPALVGHWTHHENYSSSGGFYGGSSSSIVLFADGRIGDGGSKSYASGPNSSGNSSGGGNSTIEKVSASGARWFTKGNIFYWRVKVNGQFKDVPNSKYFIKDGALLLTDLQTGKKMLYYRK
jgi:hypothetical protein